MLNYIDVRIETEHTLPISMQFLDVIDDLKSLNIPSKLIEKIETLLRDADWSAGETVSYVDNLDSIHFYFCPILCSGGITFDFNQYKENL